MFDYRGDSASFKKLCMFLTTAIHLGEPVYASGDIRGCYDIYAATTRLVLRVIEGCEIELGLLRETLAEVMLQPDVDVQAWLLRRAFDRILGEHHEDPDNFEQVV